MNFSSHHHTPDLLSISMDTLIEVSEMLGHPLEDRGWVREGQEPAIWEPCAAQSAIALKDPDKAKHFYFGCFDFLVEENEDGTKFFHPIEFNGTGMAGISNLPSSIIQTLLTELYFSPQHYYNRANPYQLILCPSSGTISLPSSATRGLIYERILCAQALKYGLKKAYGSGKLYVLENAIRDPDTLSKNHSVILGHHKDFSHHINLTSENSFTFLDKPISGSFRDQFCDNLYYLALGNIDPEKFYALNSIFRLASDKGSTYSLLKEYLTEEPDPYVKAPHFFCHAFSREELITCIEGNLNQGKQLVIKPHAAGLGRGIDFFLSPHSSDEIIEKVDSSIQSIQKFYGLEGSIFPYTVCSFVDSPTITQKNHPASGHRYELRIFVYREGSIIKAIPSIIKIAGKAYTPENPDRWMLLNNVAASHGKNAPGFTSLHPLANEETLALIDLSPEHLQGLCRFSSGFIAKAVDRYNPVTMGLDLSHDTLAKAFLSTGR